MYPSPQGIYVGLSHIVEKVSVKWCRYSERPYCRTHNNLIGVDDLLGLAEKAGLHFAGVAIGQGCFRY